MINDKLLWDHAAGKACVCKKSAVSAIWTDLHTHIMHTKSYIIFPLGLALEVWWHFYIMTNQSNVS